MNCALEVCGSTKIQNPSESDIRQAVSALDTKHNDAFLILGPTNMTYIQVTGDPKVGFDVEYQESNLPNHYRSRCDFTVEEIVRTLVEYYTGPDEWIKSGEWERIRC